MTARHCAEMRRFRSVRAGPPALGFLLASMVSGSASALEGTPEQRRASAPDNLPALRRRDPERPGDHRMPAPAKGEPEPGLRGSIRAVTIDRRLLLQRGQILQAASAFGVLRTED